MIKNFKIFEEINKKKPEEGDYIVIFNIFHAYLLPYTDNQIGTIVSRINNKYRIKYDNIPKNLIDKFGISANTHDLLTPLLNLSTITKHGYWSKNKEELETILQAKKYNL